MSEKIIYDVARKYFESRGIKVVQEVFIDTDQYPFVDFITMDEEGIAFVAVRSDDIGELPSSEAFDQYLVSWLTSNPLNVSQEIRFDLLHLHSIAENKFLAKHIFRHHLS